MYVYITEGSQNSFTEKQKCVLKFFFFLSFDVQKLKMTLSEIRNLTLENFRFISKMRILCFIYKWL